MQLQWLSFLDGYKINHMSGRFALLIQYIKYADNVDELMHSSFVP